MISVRNVLVGLAVAFTAYLAAWGLWGAAQAKQPLVVLVALGMYLVTTWLCLFWTPVRDIAPDPTHPLPGVGSRGPAQLPATAAALALACALLVPSAISIAIGSIHRQEPYATWYVGGIGALMTIVMVRRRTWTAWIGTAALAIASMAWLGPVDAIGLGLLGSVVWVTSAQLLLRSMDRAARDTARLAQLQRAASAWQASQVGRQRERRVQVQQALVVAGPVLARTVSTGGRLSEADRLEARLAEGRLRDEMRGPRLLDDDVRAELERARRRGANVTVLDEGGLEGLDEDSLRIIRAQLADTLRSAASDRLYIRTSPHDTIAVTVVGRSAAGAGWSDEDAVDLWREIAHPQAD